MTPERTEHPDEALADLATGAPVPQHVARHVAGCARCTREVDELRAVAELARTPLPALVPPPPSVWDAVLADIARSDSLPGDGVRGIRPADEASPSTGGRRVAVWWLGAAAAVGLLAGGAGVSLLQQDDPDRVVLSSARLDTLDTRQALGAASAVRVDGHLDLDLETAALDPGPGYLEVWLINRDLKRMVSVGVLRPAESHQRFAIDQALLDEGYVIVDISREGFDDRPEHSGDSIARGTLAL
jgi:hypothetical protein